MGDRRVQVFGGETWGKGTTGGDRGVDGRIKFRWILRKWDVWGMDWNELVRDRDRWRALVNAVMKLRVP
jgi:hypothetical protein